MWISRDNRSLSKTSSEFNKNLLHSLKIYFFNAKDSFAMMPVVDVCTFFCSFPCTSIEMKIIKGNPFMRLSLSLELIENIHLNK